MKREELDAIRIKIRRLRFTRQESPGLPTSQAWELLGDVEQLREALRQIAEAMHGDSLDLLYATIEKAEALLGEDPTP